MLAFPVIDSAGWLFWRLTAEQLDISNLIFIILFYVPDHRKPRTVVQSYSVFCCHFYHSFINAKKYGNLSFKIKYGSHWQLFEMIRSNFLAMRFAIFCKMSHNKHWWAEKTLCKNVVAKWTSNGNTFIHSFHSFINSLIVFIYFLISKDALN